MFDAIICDTTVLLYLGRIKQIELLGKLFTKIYTTETVCRELDSGRLIRSDTIDPRKVDWIQVVHTTDEQLSSLPDNQLDVGEQSVLAYAYINNISAIGLDDQLARKFALSLNINVIGTIGVLIRAKQNGYISQIRELLHQLSSEGFYISDVLLDFALQKVNEA